MTASRGRRWLRRLGATGLVVVVAAIAGGNALRVLRAALP